METDSDNDRQDGNPGRRVFGGPFSARDGSLLSFILRDSDDSSEWERHDGVPFPSKLLVSHMAGPLGLPDAGLNGDDYPTVILYTFEMHNGIPECTDLHLSAGSANNRSVRAKDLDYVKIDDVLEAALGHLAMLDRLQPQQSGEAIRSLMRRRRIVSVDVLREVARVYEANIDQAPTQAVADHFDISKSAADKRVKRARDAGFITRTAKSGRKPQQ